jgi:rRNA maturation endonuclease Nob1
MGMFTSLTDQDFDEARKRVVSSEQVCPACKGPFSTSGDTLSAVNTSLGLEAHTCPHCGHVLTRRLPSPDGL